MPHSRLSRRTHASVLFSLTLCALAFSLFSAPRALPPSSAAGSPPGPKPAQAATLQFSASGVSAGEGDLGVSVTVSRAGDASAPASVDYSTGDGTASERSDYTAALGTLRFAAGESSKSLKVLVTDDSSVEGHETFSLTLGNPSGGAVLGARSVVTLTVIDNDTARAVVNPADAPQFFVRQHYLDFLGREPDAAGLSFWARQISACGADPGCVESSRVNVSAAFFLSIEFQRTGFLAYRFHQAAYGTGERLRRLDFLRDAQKVGRGVVVGQGEWQALLEANAAEYAAEFVLRPGFLAAYPPGMSHEQLVDKLNLNTGGSLTQAERDELVRGLDAGLLDRAAALLRVAENAAFVRRELNKAFVLMQYFGYLRRNPDEEPQGKPNFDGYNFWLTKLNQFNGDFVQAEMVRAFISSIEYRSRFAPDRVLGKHEATAITAAMAGRTLSAGNEIYRVHVQEEAGHGVGLFTITTGPAHPSGAGLDVLYGNGHPGTSFTTVRSYASGVDYIQGVSDKTSRNGRVMLDAYGTVTPLDETGFRTTYVLPGAPATPDALTITQEINVRGSTLRDSLIEVTTRAANRGPQPAQVGIRYLLDAQSAADDGPVFQDDATRQVWARETEFRMPAFPTFTTTDNDDYHGQQDFHVVGTSRPVSFAPTATQPDLLQYACWPKAFGTAFDYAPDAADDNATTAGLHQTGLGGGDSAVIYYFGAEGSPLTIEPAAERAVSVSLFAFSPNAVPPCHCEVVSVTANPPASCVGEPFGFTAQVQNLRPGDKIVWSAPNGTPTTAEGLNFTTSYETAGTKTVTASCVGSSSSSKSTTVTPTTVTSVTLVPVGSPFSGNPNPGGGLRMFPDQHSPSDTTERRTVNVVAVVSPAVANEEVSFRVFDLDDPSTDAAPVDANAAAGGDNRGDGTGTPAGGQLSAATAVTDGSGVAIVTLTVSRQPGNNFAVTASCNANYSAGLGLRANNGAVIEDSNGNEITEGGGGQPATQARRTPMLTVWRNLHIEMDTMSSVVANSVSGLITDLQDATGTATAVLNAFRLIVNNNLRDRSADLDAGTLCGGVATPSPSPGNGRFENGTLIVGGATIISGVDANGCFRIERAAGMTIAAGGPSFFAVDNDFFGNSTMSGTVTVIQKVGTAPGAPPNFALRLNITVGAPPDWDDFVGGTISVAGGPPMPISVVSSGTSTVEVPLNALRIPYTLVDDDLPNGSTISPPDLSQLDAAFKPAYVRPLAVESPPHLVFIANIQSDSPLHVREGWMFDGVAHHARNDFWLVYLRGAFQHATVDDSDPDDEGAVLGIVDMLGPVGQGANIYKEVLRAGEFTPNPASGRSEAHTVAHEIGHLFMGFHTDGCPPGTDPGRGCTAALLMASTSIRISPDFNGVTLDKIRSAPHP